MKNFGIVFMALLAPVAFASESLDSTAQRMLKMGKGKSMSMGMKSMKNMKSGSKKKSTKSTKTAAPTAEPLTSLFSFIFVDPPETLDIESAVLSAIVSVLSDDRRRLTKNTIVLATFFEDWSISTTPFNMIQWGWYNPCEGCSVVDFLARPREPIDWGVPGSVQAALEHQMNFDCDNEVFPPVCREKTESPTLAPTSSFTSATNAPVAPTEAPADQPSSQPSLGTNTTNATITRYLERGGDFLDWDDFEEEEQRLAAL